MQVNLLLLMHFHESSCSPAQSKSCTVHCPGGEIPGPRASVRGRALAPPAPANQGWESCTALPLLPVMVGMALLGLFCGALGSAIKCAGKEPTPACSCTGREQQRFTGNCWVGKTRKIMKHKKGQRKKSFNRECLVWERQQKWGKVDKDNEEKMIFHLLHQRKSTDFMESL